MLRHTPLILTFIIGSIFSITLFFVEGNLEEEKQRIEFESRARGYANAITEDLSEYKGIQLYLYALSTSDSQKQLLYLQSSGLSEKTKKEFYPQYKKLSNGFYWSTRFQFADREWEILFIPSLRYLKGISSWQSWIGLFGGLFLTGILVFYLFKKSQYLMEIEKRILLQDETNEKLAQEIIDRKKAEEELQDNEKQLRFLMDKIPALISLIDEGYVYRYVNQQFCDELGITTENILGFSVPNVLGEKGYQTILPKLKQAFAGEIVSFETTITIRNNPPKNRIAFYIPHWKGGKVDSIFAFIQDITKQKILESQLRQSQKMEALGTLAGGIAHDFNNILSIILGNTELLMLDVPKDGSEQKYFGHILNAGDRAANLVRQILTFSRREVISLCSLNLSEVIEEALKMVRATIPTTIEIHQDFLVPCPSILGDATQINQVIFNLCSNASHAMVEQPGDLYVTLQKLDPTHSVYLKEEGRQDDIDFLLLTIRDTGVGIEPEILKQVFDPFFTTKEVGKGTGLGLSVIHGIVESHHGKIVIESKKGEGTSVFISFPIMIETQSPVDDSNFEPKTKYLEEGHILIVDDEIEISNLQKEYLEGRGYRVTTCRDGVEALQVFQKDPDSFNLVFTDQAMPNMAGKELIQEILSIRPSLPIILSTGYSKILEEEEKRQLGVHKYLQKPIQLVALQEAIDDCLKL